LKRHFGIMPHHRYEADGIALYFTMTKVAPCDLFSAGGTCL